MIELRSIEAANKILLLNYLKILMHASYTVYVEMKDFKSHYFCIVDYGF